MEITPLSIAGAFAVANTVHGDDRGEFVEWCRADHIKNHTGLDFSTVQANLSVSQKEPFGAFTLLMSHRGKPNM